MNRLVAILVIATFACLTRPAPAHPGPRVWIGSANGTVVTYSSDNDLAPTTYTPERLFVGGIDEETLTASGLLDEYPFPGTGIFATEFPGYQVRGDGQSGIPFGTGFGFKFAGPLLAFDPAAHAFVTAQAMFGTPGPAPKVNESTGTNHTLSGAGVVNGYNFLTYNTPTDHAHLTTTLIGDGTHAVDGPAAVYAVPLELTSAGLADSLPYYVLFGRDYGYLPGGPNQPVFLEAAQVARSTLVPEPGSFALVGVTLLALGRRLRAGTRMPNRPRAVAHR